MSDLAIRAESLGKRYHVGRRQEKYSTLRESLMRAASAPFQRLAAALHGKPLAGSDETFWALKDLSFEIKRGEVIGIIGRNGAGKSTLLKILSRITEPTEGLADIYGRVGSLLEVGTGFHPELTGRENIYLNGAILGMRRAEISQRFDEIVAFAEIDRFLDTPVKHYSSGMYVRLAFAVAAHLEPEILLIDEVLAVGDSAFQRKCLGKMQDVATAGRTVLFVSHDMQAVRQLCQRVTLLDRGAIAFTGGPAEAIARYFGGAAPAGARISLAGAGHRSAGSAGGLVNLEFLDCEGQPRKQISRQEQLTVRVGFSVTRPLQAFNLAMAIVQGGGTPVFSESLSDHEESPALVPGEYQVEFTFEAKYLKLETYFLTLYLLDDGTALDHVDGIPIPEIVDPDADVFMEARRWGVVRLPTVWSPISRSQ